MIKNFYQYSKKLTFTNFPIFNNFMDYLISYKKRHLELDWQAPETEA